MAETTPSERAGLKPWPLLNYAPGSYMCRCEDCGESFEGDKRATRCLSCTALAVHAIVLERNSLLAERDALAGERDKLTLAVNMAESQLARLCDAAHNGHTEWNPRAFARSTYSAFLGLREAVGLPEWARGEFDDGPVIWPPEAASEARAREAEAKVEALTRERDEARQAAHMNATSKLANRFRADRVEFLLALMAACANASILEMEDQDERIRELEAAAEIVSEEFEKDCWVAVRRLLQRIGHTDFSEGVTANDACDLIWDAISGTEREMLRRATEVLAKTIYEGWRAREGWVPWVERGNSLKQDEARREARALLSQSTEGKDGD